MEQEHLITIVIPVYNRELTLMRCLGSLAEQSGIDSCRIIIVDNNSTDASAALAAQWRDSHPDLAVSLAGEVRQGAAAARNTGLAMTETPYVMFFDSDDVMLPGHISRLLSAIAENPDVGIFGWDICCQLPDGRLYRAPFRCRRPMRDHLIHSSLSTQRFAAKTELVRRAGGWDTALTGWDDYELGVRLIALSPRIVALPDEGNPLVRTYFTDDSITGAKFSVAPHKWEDALARIERTVAVTCHRELGAVAFRRAALAGLYAREGAADDGRRLLATATAGGFGRIKARAVYETARLFGKGTRVLAWLMLR